METGSGDVLQVISHRVSSIEKTAKCRVELPAVFILSSVLRARDISREDQTGDCDEHIEKLNIVHAHHLRFCTMLRRKPPVDPTCLHGFILSYRRIHRKKVFYYRKGT